MHWHWLSLLIFESRRHNLLSLLSCGYRLIVMSKIVILSEGESLFPKKRHTDNTLVSAYVSVVPSYRIAP
jgi:hypothetical protein